MTGEVDWPCNTNFVTGRVWLHFFISGFGKFRYWAPLAHFSFYEGAAEIFTVQAILIGRIQAMYMGDKRIMIPLISLYIFCGISAIVVVSVSVWSVES